MGSRVVLWMTAMSILVSGSVRAADEISVAVMEFASKGGVSQKQMDALSDFLANEIRGMGDYRVIGKSDIRAALQLEEQKSLLGCSDESCIAEIGGALGVRWVITGNISKFGSTFLMNLKVLDVEKIKVAKGVSKKITGGEDKLIDALSNAARELIAGVHAKLGTAAPPPPVEKTVEEGDHGSPSLAAQASEAGEPPPTAVAEAPKSPYHTWGHVAMWSGVGLTALGVGAMILSINEASAYEDENNDPKTRLDSADMSRTWAGVMWLGLGAGVAAMATGALLWWLEPEQPPTTALSFGPVQNGGGLVFSLGGRW